MNTERYFILVKDDSQYIENKTNLTSSLAKAKRFDAKYEAYDYIKKYQLSKLKVAELTLSASYVTYANQDRPMTKKQADLINKLITKYGYSYPNNVKTVKEASEWLSETLDDINQQQAIDDMESDVMFKTLY